MKRARQHAAACAGGEAVRRQAEQNAQQVFPVIEEIRAGGATSRWAIAKEMNRRGMKTWRGNPWSRQQVGRVLERVKKHGG